MNDSDQSDYLTKQREKNIAKCARYRARHPDRCKESNDKYCAKYPERVKARHDRYHAEHSEEIKKRRAKFYAEHKSEEIARSAKYRAEHPEKTKAASDRFRAKHPERVKESRAKSYVKNLEKERAGYRKWRSSDNGRLSHAKSKHLRRALGALTIAELKEIKANSHGVCPYCMKPITKGHFDHIVPVTEGGASERSNMIWVCAKCNQKKSDKHLTEFLYKQTPVGKQSRLL